MPSVLGNTPLDTQIALASDVPGGGGGYANATAVAPAFSTSETYAVGDYCTYEGALYKCTTAVSTAGDWNSANWTAVAVTGEMGGGGASYYEIEYLESTGEQYIDTGVTAGLGVRVVAEVEWNSLATNDVIFGSVKTGSPYSNRHFICVAANSTEYVSVGAAGSYLNPKTSAVAVTTGTRYTYDFTVTASAATLLVNGNTAISQSGTYSFDQNLNIFAFARNDSGTAGEGSSIKLYSLKIYSGDTIVRDFVPIRVGLEGGLYDKVSYRFFTNGGTVKFGLGRDINPSVPTASPAFTGTPTAPTAPSGTNTTQVATTAFVQGEVGVKADKVVSATSGDFAGLDANGNLTDSGKKAADFVEKPPYDAEIEYLESTGTQYVDTGVVPTIDTAIEVSLDGWNPDAGETQYLFGVHDTDYKTNVYAFGKYVLDQGYFRVFVNGSGAMGTNSGNTNHGVGAMPVGYIRCDSSSVTIDSTTYSYTHQPSTPLGITRTMYLMQKNEAGSINTSRNFVGRIKSCAIYDGSTLVRDYIPVRKNGIGHLYDRVSGQLFGNSGTGDFTLGPDIDVHNALTNANANFDNIKHWLTDSTFTFKPTITFKSGWSASSDVEFRIVNGRIAHVSGNIKCTSALTAGTSYTPFSTFSFPTGVNYYAGCRLGANQRVWIYFNGTSTTIIPEVNIDANTNIYLRGLIPMTVNPDTATSYVKYIAPLF